MLAVVSVRVKACLSAVVCKEECLGELMVITMAVQEGRKERTGMMLGCSL